MQTSVMFDWNDLKAFLAVARSGSTLAAAKILRVNQTTVARRVEGLEAALSLKLFERGQTGSRLTEIGQDLLAEAERLERAAQAFQNRAQAHSRGLAGTLRVTAIELVANMLLTPAIAEFRRHYPEVKVDLLVTDDVLDIEGGEADVAIRFADEMPTSNLIARKLAEFPHTLYCSRDYAAWRGRPAGPHDLAGHDLIGGEGDLERLPTLVWMFRQAGGVEPAHRSNSMSNLVHAVRAGLGVAPLACVVGDADPALLRCSDHIVEAPAAAWLVMRRELKDTPRMRAFVDFLVPFLRRDSQARIAFNRKVREEVEAEFAASGAREA
jgi:DNA-binding transcriptional LysR family regulator